MEPGHMRTIFDCFVIGYLKDQDYLRKIVRTMIVDNDWAALENLDRKQRINDFRMQNGCIIMDHMILIPEPLR